ncbi:MAG: fused MFS/spermidine synthase [Caulobacteraceae bacterium]
MSDLAVSPSRATRLVGSTSGLFAACVFFSAALVFLVEPMVGKLLLPQLGGSSAVWNTTLAFFQIALLAGYAYAHLLQRLRSRTAQAALHIAVLAAAGLVLPLKLSTLLGEPPVSSPVLWLLGVLALSVGAPFAVLSASAPLFQAWFSRLEGAKDPYRLYVASNLGSLLALAAYPALVEPFLTLSTQRLAWSVGYGGFVVVAAILAALAARGVSTAQAPAARDVGTATSWTERLVWVGLAALPSSLMLGVTTQITTDVASAPFLWVVPLALYLLTFVIAFQARPAIGPDRARLFQAAAVALLILTMPTHVGGWPVQLGLHLLVFFLAALICCQALAARKPPPARLTEFYLLMSLGGVIGGGFNAFLAPVLFDQVWEYPLALALCGLAQPWSLAVGWRRVEVLALAIGLAVTVAVVVFAADLAPLAFGALLIAAASAFLLRNRGPAFAVLVGAALAAGYLASAGPGALITKRSFFGVHRVAETDIPGAGKVKLLFHGTTLHGAEASDPAGRCTPMTYYAPQAPMGQVFQRLSLAPPGDHVGVVGLGTGAVAPYARAGDTLRFFEIDPAVVAIARDSGRFHFLTDCAHARVDYVLGDARLTLAREAPAAFDLLLIDAFSSDSVPTHLLTVEAMTGYLAKLKPDGVLLLHLTNRNLALVGPASAAAHAAAPDAQVLVQRFTPGPGMAPPPVVTRSTVMMISRSPKALAAYAADPRWRPAPAEVKPWTDDYTNVAGALLTHLRGGV